jgi:hypothetical protein
MMNLNKILTLGAGAVILLSSCSTSYNAMKGGESDDLYFMASDATVATQFAVANNNPQNFQSLNSINSNEFEQENFSARNVNPEYIAKYQTQSSSQDSGTVYFDDNETQETSPNVNVYNNFYGSGAGVNGAGFGQSNFNFGLGFGMGMGMGMGWGMPMWGMGMWDPFWGMPMWGMRPGWGMGFGWNSMWGWNMGMGMGMGWGMPMWGNPWMNPWMGGMWGMGPRWGWGAPIIVIPGGGERRQVVTGPRPGRGAGTSVSGPRGGTENYAATSRAARREATTGNRGISEGTRGSSRDFGTSQNEYNSARSRVANNSANPGYRNTGSAAATRPSSRTGLTNTRPSYNTGTNTRSAYGTAPSRGTTAPGTVNRNTGTTRGSSPSYNRGNTGGTLNNTRTAPSRNYNTSPSRGGMSTPSRGGSSMGAPSRSSGGGFSSGGMSSGGSRGGGGMSSGGSRGGRGN